MAALPVALAAAGQAIAVISGGIDLSVGSMMALTSVTAAVLMKGASEEFGGRRRRRCAARWASSWVPSTARSWFSRAVPDIVVTLAMLFVWAGAALLVLNTPGGGAADVAQATSSAACLQRVGRPRRSSCCWWSWACLDPAPRSRRARRSTPSAATSSRPSAAAWTSSRTKVAAYALTGLFAAMGGLALTMSTGIGTPIPGPYLLASVAAVVLGGVSLAGGRGGLVGRSWRVFILRLVAHRT